MNATHIAAAAELKAADKAFAYNEGILVCLIAAEQGISDEQRASIRATNRARVKAFKAAQKAGL